MRVPPQLVLALSSFVIPLLAQQGVLPPAPPSPVPPAAVPPAAAAPAEAATPPASPTPPVRDELTNRVVGLLRDTAFAGPTAFTEERQWDYASRAMANPPPKPAPRTTRGMFAADELHLQQTGDESLHVVGIGRRLLVRKDDGPWQLAGRHSRLLPSSLSDPSVLLWELAEQLPAVADRSLGEKNGQAVEIYGCVLARPQIDALVDAGALLEPNTATSLLQQFRRRGRPLPVDLPPDEVDVRIEVDVRSRQVTGLYLRSVTKALDPIVLMAATRGQGAPPGAAVAEPPTPKAATAYTFQDGLPVRASEGLEVRWIDLRLSEHGCAAVPPLDAEAKRLLGR